MLPEISDVKRRRLSLGLKQNELSRAAGVSQSLIAKIESGKLNPSYDIAKKIFAALDHHERKEEKTAKDVMTKHLIFAKKNETVKNVARIMKKHGISQLPVASNEKIIGSITEKAIMEKIGEMDFEKLKIESIMEESFPTVSDDAPVSLIKSLLGYSQAVVVMKRSRPVGIIAKSDILKMAK